MQLSRYTIVYDYNRIFRRPHVKHIKYWASLLTGAVILASLCGCTLPFTHDNSSDSSTEISYTAFDNKATDTEDIINFIIEAMSDNQTTCNIFVPDSDLIDANEWLTRISGIEQIKCEYRRIKDGYNLVVTFECWDNYAIIKAFNSGNTSQLNSRQVELYNKYIEVLAEVTSPARSDYENELAIHDYLVSHITYIDNGGSTFNAYDAMINGEAVCSGYTESFKTFMDMLGIENYTISGKAGNEQHIWNVVKLDNDWYQVDVTWDDPVGSSQEYIDHSYFNISDSDMAIDHTWTSDSNETNPANGYIYTYPVQAKLHSAGTQYELDRYILRCIKSRSQHIEFTTTNELDIKSAVSNAGVQLSYSYKTTIRNNYTMYSVTFSY